MMHIRFKTYNYDKSSYLNYKDKIFLEALHPKKRYKTLKANMPLLDPVSNGFDATVEVGETAEANIYRANYTPISWLITGNEYAEYMAANDRKIVLPKEGVHWTNGELEPGLGTFAQSKNRLLRYVREGYTRAELQSYHDYVANGPNGNYQFTAGMQIFPFISKFRIQNTTLIQKRLGSSIIDTKINTKASNTEYFMSAVGIKNVFDKAKEYFDQLSDKGIAAMSAYVTEGTIPDDGTRNVIPSAYGLLRVITDVEHSECVLTNVAQAQGISWLLLLDKLVRPKVINDANIAAGTSVVVTVNNEYLAEDDPLAVRYAGTPYEYVDTTDLEHSSNVGPYVSAYHSSVSGNVGVSAVLDSANIRGELFEISDRAGEDSNLRGTVLDEIDNGTVEISVEEAVQMVIPLLANHLNSAFGLPAGCIEEVELGGDSGKVEYNFINKLSTFYSSTAVLKQVFNKVYTDMAVAAYYEESMATPLQYPIGKVLDLYGGLRNYLTMDLDRNTSLLEFSFKSVNYDDVSMYDKGNDPDKASDLNAIRNVLLELGEDNFLDVVDVVVIIPYTPAINGVDGIEDSEAFLSTDALVIQYHINWVRVFEKLSAYELDVLLPAFYGYLNLYAKRKSRGFLGTFFMALITVVMAWFIGPGAVGFGFATTAQAVATLAFIGAAISAVGMLTGSEMLMQIGSIIGIAAALYGGYSALMSEAGKTSLKEALLTELRKQFTERIGQSLVYGIKLASHVQQQKYEKKFDTLRSGININVEVVNEMEELITEIETDRNLCNFIYDEHIKNKYSELYDYKWEYKYN